MRFDGKALSEQIKEGWTRFIEELNAARTEDQFLTFLDKHVRDAETRRKLKRRIRILFSRQLPREAAEILLKRFYERAGEAVSEFTFDKLSPTMHTSLQGAADSLHVDFPKEAVLDGIYGEAH